MFVDSHAHLDMSAFDSDREEVISRAGREGVGLIVAPGIDLSSSRAVVALAERHPSVVATVGVHPNNLGSWQSDTIAWLESLARHPKVVAIGEIGLDQYRKRAPLELQLAALRAQLRLAARLGIPAVIHDREAHTEVLAELLDWIASAHAEGRSAVAIVHAFSGDAEMAARVVELGSYVSVAGPVTYPRAERLREVCRQVPLDRLLLETDSPFLAPQPVRGRRNEPAYVTFVAREIAAIRGIGVEAVASATTANAQRLFGSHRTIKSGEEEE